MKFLKIKCEGKSSLGQGSTLKDSEPGLEVKWKAGKGIPLNKNIYFKNTNLLIVFTRFLISFCGNVCRKNILKWRMMPLTLALMIKFFTSLLPIDWGTSISKYEYRKRAYCSWGRHSTGDGPTKWLPFSSRCR